MLRVRMLVRLLPALVVLLATVAPAGAANPPYQTGFIRWRAADDGFSGWQLQGLNRLSNGSLQLNLKKAQLASDPYPPGGYYGHNFYNGGSFRVGEALGPVVNTTTGFYEAIASWNASTPAGTWIETLIRAQVGGSWTKWYNLEIWASATGTVERHSVNLQGDANGHIAVDTLVLNDKSAPAVALQLKVRLFGASSSAVPTLRNISVAYSTTPAKPGTLAAGDPTRWNKVLPVPECSQMVYVDGGEVWCSPTSTSMVLRYWAHATGPCEPWVRAAVDGAFDWLYDGHGNWPFNTAYAATEDMEGYVGRFTSMARVEAWVAAGVPVVISYAWKKGDLAGAPISSSNGHLAVIVGFDTAGNPVVNDPAAASDQAVQRTYNRRELESLWLEHSGGTVYLIYPAGWPVPSF